MLLPISCRRCLHYLRPLNSRFFCSAAPQRIYDVLVCGGGVVGSAFISSLLHKISESRNRFGTSSIKIGLIESNSTATEIPNSQNPDLRVYALSPKSIDILTAIGAWKHIQPRSQPYTAMQVWESNGPGVVHFQAQDMSIPRGELGRICEDSAINAAILLALMDAQYEVDIIKPASLIALKTADNSYHNDFLSATIKHSVNGALENISARLIVGADGNNSVVRKLSGIPTWGFEYGQEAVVATVKVSKNDGSDISENNHTAWQKYLPTGPLALLPLWNGHSSIVWSTNVAESRRLQSLSGDDLVKEINRALQENVGQQDFFEHSKRRMSDKARKILPSWLLSEVTSLGNSIMSASLLSSPFKYPPLVTSIASKVVSFPLSFQQAKQYVSTSGRVAIIGDAAHTIHPQAGQGLNLGLLDVEALSDAIVGALLAGQDIGSRSTLSKYEEDRYWKNLGMMTTVDTINSLFKLGHPSSAPEGSVRDMVEKRAAVVRTFGMLGVNALPALKEFIANFAVGNRK